MLGHDARNAWTSCLIAVSRRPREPRSCQGRRLQSVGGHGRGRAMIRRTPILRWSAKKWARKGRKENSDFRDGDPGRGSRPLARPWASRHAGGGGRRNRHRPDRACAWSTDWLIGLKRNLGSPMTAAQREFGSSASSLALLTPWSPAGAGQFAFLRPGGVNAQPEGGPNGAPAGQALNRRKAIIRVSPQAAGLARPARLPPIMARQPVSPISEENRRT